MLIQGHEDKAVLRAVFGPQAAVRHDYRSFKPGRAARWPVTEVSLSYAAALEQLRQRRGPTARFKRMDQAGVPGWQTVVGSGSNARVYGGYVGAPDWAALLAAAF